MLSIITINYNNAEGLRKTLASVASQTFRDFEHIIVDGGSTDGSVDVIREYADNEAIRLKGYEAIRQENSKADKQTLSPNHLITSSPIIWISEPDKGIYNAMNKGIEIAFGKRIVNSFNRSELVEDKSKGIKMASGEYLLFLNSGDYLVDPDILSKVFQIAKDNIDVIYGDIKVVYNNQEIIKESPDVVTLQYLYSNAIFHSGGSFIKKSLFDSYGLYDENLRIVSDWKFFIEVFILKNVSYQHLNMVLSVFDLHGISTENQELMINERQVVLKELFPERILLDYKKFSNNAIRPLNDYSKKELLKTLLLKIFKK